MPHVAQPFKTAMFLVPHAGNCVWALSCCAPRFPLRAVSYPSSLSNFCSLKRSTSLLLHRCRVASPSIIHRGRPSQRWVRSGFLLELVTIWLCCGLMVSSGFALAHPLQPADFFATAGACWSMRFHPASFRCFVFGIASFRGQSRACCDG